MKRILICLCLFLFGFTGLAFQGQKPNDKAKPDLSGTWVLDRAKSSPEIDSDVTLVISHHDPEIRMTRKLAKGSVERDFDLVYYSDGRGETNPYLAPGSNETVKSKTKWDGRKLTTRATIRQLVRGIGVYIETTEKWQLSDDGQWLTEISSVSVPRADSPRVMMDNRGVSDLKRVFKRVP